MEEISRKVLEWAIRMEGMPYVLMSGKISDESV